MKTNINDEIRKALDTGNSGGDVDVMINEFIASELHGLVISESPILNRVRRRPWPTNAYTYRKVTKGPEAGFIADGAEMVDPSNSEWDKVTVAMKYIYSRVEVTGPMQYSVADHMDIMAEEIAAGSRALTRKLENTVIFGDGSGQSFEGILKQVSTNELDLTDGSDDSPLFLSHLDEAADMPHYSPNTIAGSRAFGRRVNSLLQAQQRFVDRTEINGGFNVMTYRGMPIITLDNEHGGELGNQVVLFRDEMTHFVVQRETFVEKLAKTKDSDDYFVGMYATLAVVDENLYNAKITGADFSIQNA